MAKKKRFAAALLAFVCCAALLLSACFLAAEARHDCTGERCAICSVLHICQSLLEALGFGALIAAFSFALCALRRTFRCSAVCSACRPTLVSLRVKLSN